VVLNYALNDIERFEVSQVDLSHFTNRSRFVRVLRTRLFARRAARLREAMLRRYELAETEGSPSERWAAYYAQLYASPLWDATRRTVLEMQRVAEEAGSAFVVMTTTEITAVESFEPERYPHRTSLEALRGLADAGASSSTRIRPSAARGTPAAPTT